MMHGTQPRRERLHPRRVAGAVHRGQALTEMALVLPMLTLIFMGVLDIGRAFHTYIALANAARVGVIYAQQVVTPQNLDTCIGSSTNAPCSTVSVTTATYNGNTYDGIIQKVLQEAQGGVDTSQMTVHVCLGTSQSSLTCYDTTTGVGINVVPNECVRVDVSAPFQPITPLVHLPTISASVTGQTFDLSLPANAPTTCS